LNITTIFIVEGQAIYEQISHINANELIVFSTIKNIFQNENIKWGALFNKFYFFIEKKQIYNDGPKGFILVDKFEPVITVIIEKDTSITPNDKIKDLTIRKENKISKPISNILFSREIPTKEKCGENALKCWNRIKEAEKNKK